MSILSLLGLFYAIRALFQNDFTGRLLIQALLGRIQPDKIGLAESFSYALVVQSIQEQFLTLCLPDLVRFIAQGGFAPSHAVTPFKAISHLIGKPEAARIQIVFEFGAPGAKALFPFPLIRFIEIGECLAPMQIESAVI